MKRFTKISLIAAAVLTVLGIVGVGVGFLFGAKPSQLAQNLHVPASSFAGIREHDRNGSGGDSAERTYDSTIRKLELDVTNASVSIGTSEDNLISIKTRNAGKYFKESVRDGDTLILEDDRPNGNTALELQILLPDRMFDDMDLDLGAAELTAGKLQAREFSLDMGAGSGSIDTLLTSEDASIDVGVGELIHNSGIARINLYKKYPESLKLVHMLPAAFTIGVVLVLLASLICPWALLLLALFALIIFVDSSIQNKSLYIGILSVVAAFIQLTGYGTGFLSAWWKRCVRGKGAFSAFEKNFYE